MALAIVLQQSGTAVCEECEGLAGYKCPNPWLHDETACCPDCESIWDIREEHHEDCAMRALYRLSLTSSELARKAPEKTTYYAGR